MIEFKNALKNGDLEKLKIKLEAGIDVNDRSGEYRYPIHKAVLLKNVSIVRLFLEHNADINIQEPLQGNTPINLAIFNKDLQ
ncbi:MAG: ankyrin repeat domain-containing protein, partial [Cetobacterium sp.]